MRNVSLMGNPIGLRLMQRVFWSPLGLRAVKLGAIIGRRWGTTVLNRSLAAETNGEHWLIELLPAKPLLVDVGFHRGEFARATLKARPDGRAIGFEPAASIREQYSRLHGSDARIIVESIALSNEVGEFPFHDDASGNNSLAPIADTERTITYAVKTTTLDAYAAQAGLGYIDLLKIDAEGYDLHVLEGAEGLLDAQKIGLFMFEYNSPWVLSRRYLRDASDYIATKPYQLFKLYNGFLSRFEYRFSAERFDAPVMYVGISNSRLGIGDIPLLKFPD